MTARAALLALALLLGACREEQAVVPEPVTMTAEAVGHYCQMNVLEHPGPKAQVFLKDIPQPLFFSQVRDAIAYQRMPEQDGEIVATYVSDMAKAPSWEEPGVNNWAPIADVVFVVGSTREGGMGAPETIPFTDKARAEAFVAENGGRVATLDQITDAEVLEAAGPTDAAGAPDTADDYLQRLRALTPTTEAKP